MRNKKVCDSRFTEDMLICFNDKLSFICEYELKSILKFVLRISDPDTVL